ncbi:LPXTG cell wall anchor domain-containing protein [Clostridiales Family XIII bacterium WCA-MUC-591-APC-4B]|uniref:LPXTG cell wall anchor domain-containing protein n=1 Tax=Mogibacterium kristiansenii TaxID=2606708 RepID=A0A6N7XKK6_9FIRM|nr:LPXTG cell wall anchor domain-containing protein [Mogibacterium kristiansenii]
MSIDLVVDYSIVANPRYYKCEVISYYLDHRLVAEHKDKDDKDQTVTVSKPALDSPKTGDESSLLIWIAIAAIAAGLGGFITAREVRKRKDRD